MNDFKIKFQGIRKLLSKATEYSNLSFLFKIALFICIVFLLGRTLYDKVFRCLWEFLSLQNTLSLKGVVICISLFIIRLGFCLSRKHVDKKHLFFFLTVTIVYIYYRFFFEYKSEDYSIILIYGELDSFLIFYISFLVGFFSGKIYNSKIWKKGHSPRKESNEKSNLDYVPILLDEPINDTKDDLFRYAGLARSLAHTIRINSFDKSYCIGINAPWGKGKSSFLNLLRNELLEDAGILVVNFNPRASVNVNSIQSDFLSTLASSLSLYHTGMKSNMKDYIEDLNILADNTPWMKMLGLVRIKDATDSREKLQEGISTIGKKMVIMIDDLDRLMTDEIMEIFKLITKNAAFKNTIFITTYDKDYINGIFKNSLYIPQKHHFSDKYFNMEIDLPDCNKKILSNFLLNELVKMANKGYLTACNEQRLQHAFNKFSTYAERYLLSLRDVKRFLNTFCASYIPIQDEVYFEDYIILALIRFSNSELYENLKKLCCFESTGYSHKNIYILKSEKEFDYKGYYDVLCELFPEKRNSKLDDLNSKGLKHIYWKRSFNTYFYNLEYSSLHHSDVKALLKSNIKDSDIRKLAYNWKERGIYVDIKDFLLSIEDYQSTQDQQKAFLKICMICYRYTKEREVFFLASRAMYYYLWEDIKKKYNFTTQKEYKQYVSDILRSEDDINATSFFLHHLLLYQLSENRIEAKDCVFTDNELKKLCMDRLRKGLEYFKVDKISASDVLYLVLGCLNDADPIESGNDGYDIMLEAKDKLTCSIVEYPIKYLTHVVSHISVGANKIKFIVNEDYPFNAIFKMDEMKKVICSIDTHHDSKLDAICNFWLQYLDCCIAQKNISPTISFNGVASKLNKYDYKQYNLVFEGEDIQ